MNFAKMHGLGNDFMVIDSVTQNIYVNPEQIRHWPIAIVGSVLTSCC